MLKELIPSDMSCLSVQLAIIQYCMNTYYIYPFNTDLYVIPLRLLEQSFYPVE